MTQQEAKALSIEVWQYLADHPECRQKNHLPPELYSKIEDVYNECPLCELFDTSKTGYSRCGICPLLLNGERNCADAGSLWEAWLYSKDSDERQQAAQKILDIIKAWEPEEEAL